MADGKNSLTTNYQLLSAKSPLVAIVGPTASGKSALAMHVATKYNGEIICADSRTIYKEMDIGTAKPSREERTAVSHHCLDLVTPDQIFSVAEFKRLASLAIEDIQCRGKLPILVGGSGLYVDSVLFNYEFSRPGAERDDQNPRHLKKTDQPTSPKELRPNTLVIGMRVDKEVLNNRIEHRIDAMLEEGLIDEVRTLVQAYSSDAPGLLAPGYKAFGTYLSGELSVEQAKERFLISDRQLAKRQMTWFKRNRDIQWVATESEAMELINTFLTKFATMTT